MTYQELLDEFCKRRMAETETIDVQIRQINDLQWAVQSILEKLRDTQEGPKP